LWNVDAWSKIDAYALAEKKYTSLSRERMNTPTSNLAAIIVMGRQK